MQFYKLAFLLTLFTGTLLSVSSYSWLGMWMGLEINLLSFIPLMKSKNLLSTETSTKYFITQALASTIILMTIISSMTKTHLMVNSYSSLTVMMNSALLVKMGAAPFHFWFPEVMEGLSWTSCLVLSTWQKIAPLTLFMYNINNMKFSTLIIVSCMIISATQGFNQLSLRKILAYSSINHLGWMLSTISLSESIWLTYLVIYSFSNTITMMALWKLNISLVSQINQWTSSNPLKKILTLIMFLDLMGIPPFLGFFPKWLTIQLLTENKLPLLTMTMILFTTILAFMYMRTLITSLALNNQSSNWVKTTSSAKMLMLNISLLSLSLPVSTLLYSWS
uniref:NADH-ubiquinone oxidoreductase chain 2 n=1 Tax=Elateroidea sp. BMNH 1274729 TaxID=1796501 RepID=A0A126TGH2_9COLE|nr:NADH dehydrogenase subunit 2 [Elateroidea sp. BMNH 1274729]